MGRTVRTDGSNVLDPGFLKQQITWQERIVTGLNAFSEEIFEWRDVLTCRAQVEELQGQQKLLAQQYFADAQYGIRQHYSKGLTYAMRIAWFIDGEMLYLSALSINGAPGLRQYQDILAMDYKKLIAAQIPTS